MCKHLGGKWNTVMHKIQKHKCINVCVATTTLKDNICINQFVFLSLCKAPYSAYFSINDTQLFFYDSKFSVSCCAPQKHKQTNIECSACNSGLTRNGWYTEGRMTCGFMSSLCIRIKAHAEELIIHVCISQNIFILWGYTVESNTTERLFGKDVFIYILN